MANAGILSLIEAFGNQKISRDEYFQGLDRLIQLSQKKLNDLPKVKVEAADQSAWEATLLPGLEACYSGVIGAASEAKEFGKMLNKELLPNIAALMHKVSQIMDILANQTGLSEQTLKILADGLDLHQDVLNSSVQKGSAESQVSFID